MQVPTAVVRCCCGWCVSYTSNADLVNDKYDWRHLVKQQCPRQTNPDSISAGLKFGLNGGDGGVLRQIRGVGPPKAVVGRLILGLIGLHPYNLRSPLLALSLPRPSRSASDPGSQLHSKIPSLLLMEEAVAWSLPCYAGVLREFALLVLWVGCVTKQNDNRGHLRPPAIGGSGGREPPPPRCKPGVLQSGDGRSQRCVSSSSCPRHHTDRSIAIRRINASIIDGSALTSYTTQLTHLLSATSSG